MPSLATDASVNATSKPLASKVKSAVGLTAAATVTSSLTLSTLPVELVTVKDTVYVPSTGYVNDGFGSVETSVSSPSTPKSHS